MINAVYLLGNLAADPVVDSYEDEREGSTTVAKFVIISNGKHEPEKAKIAVSTVGAVAEIAAGFKKGQQVLVVGELQTYRWDEGGQTKEKTSLSARLVYPIEKQPKRLVYPIEKQPKQ